MEKQHLLFTKFGRAIRFPVDDIEGEYEFSDEKTYIKMVRGDVVVSNIESFDEVVDGTELIVFTDHGFAKKISSRDLRIEPVGGVGVKFLKITPRTGNVFAVVQTKAKEAVIEFGRASCSGVMEIKLNKIPKLEFKRAPIDMMGIKGQFISAVIY